MNSRKKQMTTSRLGNKFHSIHTMRWVNNGYFLFQLFAKICEFATLDIYLFDTKNNFQNIC